MKRWKIAAGFLVMAASTATAIAVAGGALGAGCSTGPGVGSACGLDAGADGGASPAVATLITFCGDLATADCSPAIVGACYGSVSKTLTQACINAATASCFKAHYQISPCNPGCLSYDADYMMACCAAHQSVFASASLTAGGLQTLAAACLGAFNSGCLQGATCHSDADCDVGAGLVCVVQAGPTGTCQVPTAEMMGDPCTGDPTAQCIDNTYCSDGGKCAWDPDGGGDAGTCPCDPDDGGGDAGTCTRDPDGGSDAGTERCPTCSDAGVPCFYDMTLSTPDGSATFDVNSSICVDGTCVSKFFDDAGCTDGGDAVCMGGFCVDGICETVYTFNPTTHPVGFPTVTAPGCAYFGAP